jgi:hypothetical protein
MNLRAWYSFIGFLDGCCGWAGVPPKTSLWDTDLWTDITDLKAGILTTGDAKDKQELANKQGREYEFQVGALLPHLSKRRLTS